jgi:hypothetical protein
MTTERRDELASLVLALRAEAQASPLPLTDEPE